MHLPADGQQLRCRLVGATPEVSVLVERTGQRLRFSYERDGRVHLVREFDDSDPMLHQELLAVTADSR